MDYAVVVDTDMAMAAGYTITPITSAGVVSPHYRVLGGENDTSLDFLDCFSIRHVTARQPVSLYRPLGLPSSRVCRPGDTPGVMRQWPDEMRKDQLWSLFSPANWWAARRAYDVQLSKSKLDVAAWSRACNVN